MILFCPYCTKKLNACDFGFRNICYKCGVSMYDGDIYIYQPEALKQLNDTKYLKYVRMAYNKKINLYDIYYNGNMQQTNPYYDRSHYSNEIFYSSVEDLTLEEANYILNNYNKLSMFL